MAEFDGAEIDQRNVGDRLRNMAWRARRLLRATVPRLSLLTRVQAGRLENLIT